MRDAKSGTIKTPSPHDWRTSDEDEIARRRLRAQTEQMRIRNLDSRHPVYSNFEVRSTSGLSYTVEVRSVSQRRFSCNCVDFRINALGTCKHFEATLLYIEARHRRLFREAQKNGAGRIDVVPNREESSKWRGCSRRAGSWKRSAKPCFIRLRGSQRRWLWRTVPRNPRSSTTRCAHPGLFSGARQLKW